MYNGTNGTINMFQLLFPCRDISRGSLGPEDIRGFDASKPLQAAPNETHHSSCFSMFFQLRAAEGVPVVEATSLGSVGCLHTALYDMGTVGVFFSVTVMYYCLLGSLQPYFYNYCFGVLVKKTVYDKIRSSAQFWCCFFEGVQESN